MIAFKELPSAEETDLPHVKNLRHVNIVRFFGVCKTAPHFGFVMELCSDYTLRSEIYGDVPIENHTLLRYAKEIASGMSYLHSKKIVHRDLKPMNILLQHRPKVVKIADFDLSVKLPIPDDRPRVAGTLIYMAPELILDRNLTLKVDLWSYGVVLWEMIARRRPYDCVNSREFYSLVAQDKLKLHVPKNCVEVLRKIVTSCLQPKPRKRPSFSRILERIEKVSLERSKKRFLSTFRHFVFGGK